MAESQTAESDSTPKVFEIQSNGHQLLPNGETLNWNRGLLNQIPKVGSCYHDWINHAMDRRVRMFDSDFLEGCSFTFWWVVPALYIPWAFFEFRDGYRYFTDLTFFNRKHGLDMTDTITNNKLAWNPLTLYFNFPVILSCIIYFIVGLMIWTLFEYYCHRFLFHWEPPRDDKHPKIHQLNLMHFLGHGMHHLTPADELRLVFPPAISLTLGITIRTLFIHVFFCIGMANTMVGGFAFGYAMYETTHYLSHHCHFDCLKFKFLENREKYHGAHHFNPKKQDSLYGVTSQIWDVVFGTY